MTLNDFKRKLIGYYLNSRGWRTNRKIIVFESDDWGSIRMPNKQTYQKLLGKGYPVNSSPYQKFDSLETKDDFGALFELLVRYRDSKGNHPIITANTIVTNPNFGVIKDSGFQKYESELFTETYVNQHGNNLISCINEGIKENIFFPQLHGKQHLNVNRWMHALRNNLGETRTLFEFGLFDLSISQTEFSDYRFVDALNPISLDELHESGLNLMEAADLFNQIFGFRSKSFIAPCYIWRPEIEDYLKMSGVDYIQSGAYQLIPEIGKSNHLSKKFHYTGQRNKLNQTYTIRNGIFEPSLTDRSQDISHCLQQIEKAFNYKKPAIISSHRVNFMGSLDETNRTKNLKLFGDLLDQALKIWKDVEFMNTSQLGDLITQDLKN